jgi:hypothetical protein
MLRCISLRAIQLCWYVKPPKFFFKVFVCLYFDLEFTIGGTTPFLLYSILDYFLRICQTNRILFLSFFFLRLVFKSLDFISYKTYDVYFFLSKYMYLSFNLKVNKYENENLFYRL